MITEQEFLAKCSGLYQPEEYKTIVKSLAFEKEKHADTKRKSGEPYYTHPIETAVILLDLGADANSICASLLHDVLEDTVCTEAEMEAAFGKEITSLVAGVTKISKIEYRSQEQAQVDNFRKLLFAVASDIRVIFIKLADRLHNMRTLEYLNADKRLRIARETLDIYSPIAARLGISAIKIELEDLCLKYLYPEEYEYLASHISTGRAERMKAVEPIAARISEELNKIGIVNAEIKGRPKHFYSIYKKMTAQKKTIDEIYDLIALRVIVNDVKECYTVLGIVHSMWKPIPGRFKDYIAMPKPNLYQSLHTTVINDQAQIFEIQIRTFEMNKVAEYGVAAHWLYKEGKNNNELSNFDKKMAWINEVIDTDRDLRDNSEFLNTLKTDNSDYEIYVFSPQGEVFALPAGSTPIDFAYKVHSAIGNKCSGAKVNGRIIPLTSTLSSGDVVEIITQSNKGPSRDWLKFVKTAQARAKIKAYFKKALAEENIKNGKEMLEKEARRRGFQLSELMSNTEGVERIIGRYSMSSTDDLYASVGYGGLTTNQVLLKLIDSYEKFLALHKPPEAELPIPEKRDVRKKPDGGVLIEGYDGFLIKLSKCCNPVPGDEILGYAARGTGVSIHRADCPNVRAMEPERLLKAAWSYTENALFTAHLQIVCNDRTGMISEICSLISNQGINITSLEVRVKPNKTALVSIGIQVKSTDECEYMEKKLAVLPDVISVKRV